MQRLVPQWPRARPLGWLLQSPAHRVVRVLLVTQSHWQLPEHRSRRRRV
jgi:hypothetical protein